MTTIFRGDDTGAFGNNFITINLENPENYVIQKAIFVCGSIKKEFIAPDFPLVVNFPSEETKQLKEDNICHLVVYDELNRQKTCSGTLSFSAEKEVI